MASLVPDPIEKCAVCAASPISTTLPCRQLRQRSVPKLIHLELLASIAWPYSMWPSRSLILEIEAWSDSPGGRLAGAMAANPAAAHTCSCISTMNVLPDASYG